MLYRQFTADWLAPGFARTPLYRGLAADWLALGHLRTLEAVGNPLFAPGGAPSPYDVGQAVAVANLPWRVARARLRRRSLLLAFAVRRATPRNPFEAQIAGEWLAGQCFRPPVAHESAAEAKARAESAAKADCKAASPALALAVQACAVPGWERILCVRSIWDAPLIAVLHLLTAKAEAQGAWHFPADLIQDD